MPNSSRRRSCVGDQGSSPEVPRNTQRCNASGGTPRRGRTCRHNLARVIRSTLWLLLLVSAVWPIRGAGATDDGTSSPVPISLWSCLDQEEGGAWPSPEEEATGTAGPWEEPPSAGLDGHQDMIAKPLPTPAEEVATEPAAGKKTAAKRLTDNLIIETVNATCWSALLDRVKAPDADIILAQEHHCLEHQVAERSSQLKNQGWRSVWAAALPTNADDPTDTASTSGGVAILVRDFLGATNPSEVEPVSLVDGRAVCARVTVPGIGPIVVYSLYVGVPRPRALAPPSF